MAKFAIHDMDLYYNTFHALKNINLELPEHQVSAFIGPSGCGKSTLLKSLNRMNDLVEGCKITGDIRLDGEDIYGDMDVNLLRKRVGMVFQKPNPFPMSGKLAPGRCHLGRGEGPSQQERPGYVRRTAAASVYRPCAGGATRSTADGRTHQRSRPDLDLKGGRSGHVAEK